MKMNREEKTYGWDAVLWLFNGDSFARTRARL